MKIPSQYLPVMPYLIVKDAKALASFIKAVFDGSEQLIVPDDQGRIIHGEMKIHDAVIMIAQSNDNWTERPGGMFIYVENVDNVYQAAIQNEAVSLMSPEQKEYGYTAGFEDLWGNQWWIVQGE